MSTNINMTIPRYPHNSSSPGQSAVAGAIRFNTINDALEMYDGTNWRSILPDPKTWKEWFEYYTNSSGTIADLYTRQVYIQQEMSGRFPGNYRVDLAGHEWVMVFNTPADETWFHLKYD